MFGWFKNLCKAEAVKRREHEILNAGLALMSTWVAHQGEPIATLLAAKFPELNEDALNRYEQQCRSAMQSGFRLAWHMSSEGIENADSAEWQRRMKAMCPWMDDANLSRLFSQGLYNVWKS